MNEREKLKEAGLAKFLKSGLGTSEIDTLYELAFDDGYDAARNESNQADLSRAMKEFCARPENQGKSAFQLTAEFVAQYQED